MIRLLLLAFTVAFAASFLPTASAQSDYMAPELRTRIQALKESFLQRPTNQANARARARDLWDWMNAYAMTGAHIPPNATSTVNALMALPTDQRISAGRRVGLDNYIKEFITLDEQPGAIGETTIAPAGPFVVETRQTIQVEYKVGERPIVEGGVVLLGRHFMSDAARWQHADPTKDNYISIQTSVSGVEFQATNTPVRGMHGGFRGPVPQLSFEISRGSLNPGDTFTLTYGDTSGGGRGFRLQTYSNDAVQLPLYLKFDPDSIFYFIKTPTYSVVGKEAARVHGFVPSIVAPGEAFEMSVRIEDNYYNRATGPVLKEVVGAAAAVR